MLKHMALTPKHMRPKSGYGLQGVDFVIFTLKHMGARWPHGFMVYGFHGLVWRTMAEAHPNPRLMCLPIKTGETYVLDRKALAPG
jgi:hypothetical protein